MIENLEEEKVFYSNKSSSSSTSSLLSYSSVSSHQMPFAPPPTPLLATMQRANESQSTIPIYQVQQQQMQQQQTSSNNLLMISAVQPQSGTTMLTSTTSDQSIFNSALHGNNNNLLTVTGAAGNSLNNNSSLIDFNSHNHHHHHHCHGESTNHKQSLFVENSNLFGHSSSSDFSLGSNSSRVKAHSNRRECKSTSDESYTIELEEQSLIASATNKIEKMCNASTSDNHSNLYKLNGGQFGYSPCSRRASALLSPHFNNKRSEQYSLLKLGIKNNDKSLSNNSKQHKKVVKRLSSNTKFFTDNLKSSNHDFTHNKKLFTSVLNNDYKTVCEMLDSNMYDVNCVDDKQRTCLHIASSRGNIEVVRMLLEYGANPNIRDCVNNLPIHLAIISSHVQVVTLLLEAGTDIHSLDLNGKTVLHLAGTRLRWLLNDENNQASPKLKFEAIMIMNMIKEYLRRKKTSTTDLDKLTSQLENTFNLDDINNITKEFLNQFETLNI